MKNLEIILIAFGLAMDCFAVSITVGATNKKVTLSRTIEVAIFFGGFQAGDSESICTLLFQTDNAAYL